MRCRPGVIGADSSAASRIELAGLSATPADPESSEPVNTIAILPRGGDASCTAAPQCRAGIRAGVDNATCPTQPATCGGERLPAMLMSRYVPSFCHARDRQRSARLCSCATSLVLAPATPSSRTSQIARVSVDLFHCRLGRSQARHRQAERRATRTVLRQDPRGSSVVDSSGSPGFSTQSPFSSRKSSRCRASLRVFSVASVLISIWRMHSRPR
jgi:hypothetical protein